MTIDLRPFCSTDPARPYLHQPFSRGEWTYATNGHVLVRVPRRPDIGEFEKAPHAERVIEKVPMADELIPLPAFVFPEPEFVECTGCDGRCMEHDCPDCQHECEICQGKGQIERAVSASIGEAIFNSRYLRLLATLPALRVPAAPPPAAAMRFVFDGGEGVLMPLKFESPTHIPEPSR